MIFCQEKKPSDYYTNDRAEMLEFVPPGAGKILEVGCGAGRFGGLLKSERQIEVWGVDVCGSATEEAQAKLDRVMIGDIEDAELDLPKNYFDCAIFNDSLEHMRYPWNVLEKIKAYLVSGGCVVASIPNVRYYYHLYDLLRYKKWQYVDEGILDKTHLRFFTEESIKDLFISCGYKIVKIQGINPIRFPWKFCLLNKLMKNKFDDMRFLQFACVAETEDLVPISMGSLS